MYADKRAKACHMYMYASVTQHMTQTNAAKYNKIYSIMTTFNNITYHNTTQHITAQHSTAHHKKHRSIYTIKPRIHTHITNTIHT